jgi:hypothetical protein
MPTLVNMARISLASRDFWYTVSAKRPTSAETKMSAVEQKVMENKDGEC